MGRLKDLLESQPVLILDGALGTELESRGYPVSGSLWSAQVLLEAPRLIEDIHLDYLRAGANLLTTASYQATLPGLMAYGLEESEAEQVIKKTVTLAQSARDRYWQELEPEEKEITLYPLIGGDVGPYAAYLANASEYTGDYGQVSLTELKDFHRSRLTLLQETACDFLILETIPNRLEVKALVELLAQEFPGTEALISVPTLNGQTMSDGTPLGDIAELIEGSAQVLALGINCSLPQYYPEALTALSKTTHKPLLAYPNSGEVYDTNQEDWQPGPDQDKTLFDYYQVWKNHSLKIIGGCCRTRPQDIARLAEGLKRELNR